MTTQSKAMRTDASANTLLSLNKRIIAKNTQNVLFGTTSADVEMAPCYPVGFNTTTGKFAPWMAPDPTVVEVDLTSATAGTFGLTVNGVVLANTTFAYDASAALVAATLRSLGYSVSVTLASQVYTITFDGEAELETLPVVTGDVTQITGGTPAVTATAGTASYGTHKVYGFVYPETITTDTVEDVQGVITSECEIVYDEIEDLVDSGDVTALKAALKDGLREKGMIIQGLVGVH